MLLLDLGFGRTDTGSRPEFYIPTSVLELQITENLGYPLSKS